MSNYLSNRQRNLKVGIESYTETTTSLSVIGKVGIGTTNAVTDLDINGSIKIDGGILDSSSSSGTNNYVVTADGSGGWSWQPVSAGVATYVDNAGYATTAGIATNLKGGSGGEIVYQSAADTTAFLTNGTSGYLLQANGGTNPPTWVPAAPADAITGLTIRDEGIIVGGANSVSQLDFVGDIISVASTAGIATITVSNSFTQLSVSGLSTFTGIGTFVSDLYVGGNVNIVGVLTAQRLYSNIYGEFTGGGITGDSIVGTALSISGISTLGSVQISSGIVTATSGIVTYYGDGQYLSGVVSPESNGEF